MYSDRYITQRYIRRFGRTKRVKEWESRLVHIETENGVWRENGYGYTHPGAADAWVLPFKEAERKISHCGPEKRGRFVLASGQQPVTI